MSEKRADDRPAADLGVQEGPPGIGAGTDIGGAGTDVTDDGGHDTPATSDPEAFDDDDGELGGTGGPSTGGAG